MASITTELSPVTDLAVLIKQRERLLMAIAAIFISLNQVMLFWVQDRSLWIFLPILVWIGCFLSLHQTLNKRLPDRDSYLLPAMFLLLGWGLNLASRLAPNLIGRQTTWLIMGTAVVITLQYLPTHLRWLQDYRYTWLVFGMVMLGATIVLGVNPSGFGPRLWLSLDGIFYQPSELLKILLVAFLASYFADHWHSLRQDLVRVGPFQVPSPSFLAPILLMFSLCVVMLVWQRDMGTASIYFIVFMLMLYVASGQWMLLVLGGILLGMATIVAYFVFDVVALRIDVWLHPWAEAEGRAFQIIQSLMAIAAGGIPGRGIGQGLPIFIPVVHSDFVFAAIAEEWGLIGIISVLATTGLIIFRGLRIAAVNQNRPFVAFFATGISLMLAVQSILIISGTLRILPLTGVTLPFVSYGGSSLLTSMVMVGLLLMMSESVER